MNCNKCEVVETHKVRQQLADYHSVLCIIQLADADNDSINGLHVQALGRADDREHVAIAYCKCAAAQAYRALKKNGL